MLLLFLKYDGSEIPDIPEIPKPCPGLGPNGPDGPNDVEKEGVLNGVVLRFGEAKKLGVVADVDVVAYVGVDVVVDVVVVFVLLASGDGGTVAVLLR